MNKNHWIRTRPIAHRGIQDLDKGIVENTLESCILAMEKGYPIEIDVRLTDEGKLILIHDSFTTRLLGKRKYYSSLRDKDLELCILDSKCKISTLESVLETVNGKVPLLIELKYQADFWKMNRLAKEVALALKKYNGEYAIQSFYSKMAKLYKSYAPDAYVGLIMPLSTKFPKQFNNITNAIALKKKNFDFISYGIKNHTSYSLNKVIDTGLPIIFYNVTNPELEAFANKCNANFIFADYENIGYIAPKFVNKE